MIANPVAGIVVMLLGSGILALGAVIRFRATVGGRPVDRASAVMLLGAAFAAGGLFALVRP